MRSRGPGLGSTADLEETRTWPARCRKAARRGVAGRIRQSHGLRLRLRPPTERRGRVHTSTVTVAVFEAPPEARFSLDDRDIEVFTARASGPGGQHAAKTDSCVVMRDRPTGIEAKSAAREQHANRRMARLVLEVRVRAHFEAAARRTIGQRRREMLGTGMRADKIRTRTERWTTG